MKPLAQHFDLDVEPAAVLLEQVGPLRGKARLQVAEQRLIARARLGVPAGAA